MLKSVYLILMVLKLVLGVQDVGWIWHVTDFHYDFSYWSDQLSCQEVVTSPGIYGDYWCDSPWLLVKDSIESMKNIRADVDFLLWTGDNIAHIEDKKLTLEKNMDILQNITNELTSNFPNIPVYATLGNHDYFPTNQLPPDTNEMYQRVGEMWKDWIKDPQEVEKFKNVAFYSVKTTHGLRILGLNTNLYYTRDKVTANMTDPSGQFAWLDEQLTSAKKNNEKVLITAHVPPGIHTPSILIWFYKHFNDKFLQIINKHVDNDVIVGMYYGHEHVDGFKVFYKSDGTPAFSAFMAPSVTPWIFKVPGETGHPHNPGIRLISYDRKTGQPINILMYYINLPDSNSNKKTDWKLEYNFTNVYKIEDVSAASIDGLTKRMADDKTLIDLYVKFKDVSVNNPMTCDEDCRETIVCGFKQHTMDTFNACKDASKSLGNPMQSPSFFIISMSIFILLARYL